MDEEIFFIFVTSSSSGLKSIKLLKLSPIIWMGSFIIPNANTIATIWSKYGDIKANGVCVKNEDKKNASDTPTLENTYSGKYPVWTYEHMYTKGTPNETTQKFLDYIMSDEYGKKMESLGYGVSSKMQVKEH